MKSARPSSYIILPKWRNYFFPRYFCCLNESEHFNLADSWVTALQHSKYWPFSHTKHDLAQLGQLKFTVFRLRLKSECYYSHLQVVWPCVYIWLLLSFFSYCRVGILISPQWCLIGVRVKWDAIVPWLRAS